MLVLSRRKGEKIILEGLGVITIVENDRNKVKIGLEFDKSIQIYRHENADKYQQPKNGEKQCK